VRVSSKMVLEVVVGVLGLPVAAFDVEVVAEGAVGADAVGARHECRGSGRGRTGRERLGGSLALPGALAARGRGCVRRLRVGAGRYVVTAGRCVGGFGGEFGDEGPAEAAAGFGQEILESGAEGGFVGDALLGVGGEGGVIVLDGLLGGLDLWTVGHDGSI